MKIASTAFIIFAAFFFVSEIEAQNKARDAKAIAMVKNLSVSKLDRRLPARSFSQWFGKVVGKSQKIEWHVNDCGEQDGTGMQPDFPICVESNAYTADRIKVYVLIAIGTHKLGITGKPEVWGAWIIKDQKELKFIDELSDLQQELALLR